MPENKINAKLGCKTETKSELSRTGRTIQTTAYKTWQNIFEIPDNDFKHVVINCPICNKNLTCRINSRHRAKQQKVLLGIIAMALALAFTIGGVIFSDFKILYILALISGFFAFCLLSSINTLTSDDFVHFKKGGEGHRVL